MKVLLLRLVQTGFFLGAVGVTLCAVSAALGFAFPLLDSFNHFQPFWFATTLAALLLSPVLFQAYRMRAFVTTLAATGFLASAIIVIPETIGGLLPNAPLSEANGRTFKLLTYNIFGINDDMAAVADMIGTQDPDIILLQEYFPGQRRALDPLLVANYPHSKYCIGGKRENIAIYAKLPFTLAADGACTTDQNDRIARIVAHFDIEGSQPFNVMTTHLDWPVQISQFREGTNIIDGLLRMTARQEGQFEEVAEAANEIAGPLILAGDFNSTSWSYAVRGLVSETGMERHTRNLWTYPKRFFIGDEWRVVPAFLPLDQVLTKNGIEVHELHTGPATGSDHLPVIFTFSVAPADLSV